MKQIIFALILAAMAYNTAIKAQEQQVHKLDLSTSIAIAKMSSYDMLILKQDIKQAEFNLKATTSNLKTHIDLSLTAPEYSENISQFSDSTGRLNFYPVKRNYLGSNLAIRQPLPTDGNISIYSSLAGWQDYNNNRRSTQLYSRIALEQPIEAFYGYNEIRTSFKTAELNYESSQKRLTREELNLVYNVSNGFYNLLSIQKQVEIAQMNLTRQQEAFEIAQNKYEAGLIREVDALQMEVDLAEAKNSYDLNKINLETASNSFKELLGLPITDSITISGSLEYIPVVVDLDKALQYAAENRLELREQDIQQELTELSLKRQRAQGRISGDINAYYGVTGVNEVSRNTDFNFGNTMDDVITDLTERGPNYGVSLQINIPIIDWGENKARTKVIEAEIQQNIYQKEQLERSIENEVRNLVAQYNNSLKRLKLLEKNVTVAEKSFKITLSRYSDGDIDSQALALERERLNNAHLSHLSAYINYELLLVDLMRKTYFNFRTQQLIN